MSKPIKYKAPKPGTVVYDVADPRHHGIVKSLHLHDGKFCASVKWIDGWHSTRVPVANLRRVTADTPSEPDRARPVLKPKRRARQIGFGVYDGFPTRFSTDTGEVWTCFMHSRSRGRKGTWSQPTRPIQVLVYECGVLTGQKYRQLFGDVPPLPPAAFRSGWSSRLGALAHDPARKPVSTFRDHAHVAPTWRDAQRHLTVVPQFPAEAIVTPARSQSSGVPW